MPTIETTTTNVAVMRLTRRPVFLAARWQALAMVNFAIDPEVLQPLVPRGTTLDLFGGVAYVSVVGFLFRDTRLLGLPIPGHIHFPEVNLRFYVQRTVGHEVRRGVCFVKELVPRWAIATVARWSYNEPYESLSMASTVNLENLLDEKRTAESHSVSYRWQKAGAWRGFEVRTTGPRQAITEGSLEEFIAEHYWGYCRQRDGGTVEYEVEHPRWNVWPAESTGWQGAVPEFYGQPWTEALQPTPRSAFLADGSAVKVFKPTRIA